jgi:hypothetical protein
MPQGSDFEQAVLENLKKEDKLRKLARELISGTKSLSTQRQTALGVFFDSTLCCDQNSREADFEKLMSFLNPEVFVPTTLKLKIQRLKFQI